MVSSFFLDQASPSSSRSITQSVEFSIHVVKLGWSRWISQFEFREKYQHSQFSHFNQCP